MANLFIRTDQNGTSKYYGNITSKDKRIRKCLGHSKQAAELALKKLEYDLLFSETKKEDIQHELKPACISFLASLEITGISTLHLKSINGKVRAFKAFCDKMSHSKISDITPEVANQFIRSRAKQRVSNKYFSNFDDYVPKLTPTTLNKDIETLKRLFNYFIDMQWIQSNPFRSIKRFKNLPKQRYHFSDNEIKRIMDNAGKFYDFYYLLLKTGIRSTDAYKLKADHFDGKYLNIQMNKTGDFLSIPLPEEVLTIIKDRMDNSTIFPLLQSDRQRRSCVKNIQRLFEPGFVRTNNINLVFSSF